MSYEELLKLLQTLSTEQLQQDLVVEFGDEYYPARTCVAMDSDVLGGNHLVVSVVGSFNND